MQISENVHAIRIPFQIPIGPGKALDRFVYAYLICGTKVTLIDAGVSSSTDIVASYLQEIGRRMEDVGLLILTHSHPDHIGGARGIVARSDCLVASHVEEVPWIEDTERQFRERPIPGFHSLVQGPVGVDLPLQGGENLDLGGGLMLKVIHTPGHSRGSISLHLPAGGILISGDAVPLRGGFPIYEDVAASLKSLEELKGISGLRILLSSWDEPRSGEQIYSLLEEGVKYIRCIHDLVCREKERTPALDFMELGRRVMKALGFPESLLGPVAGSLEAHLKACDDRKLT